MAVKETSTSEKNSPAVDYTEVPGFHVIQGNTHCGTYETEEDAQMFIDGQIAPQGLKASIVEGAAE